jgi:LysM repeat protein
MANLHTIGAYTYKMCGDGSVTVASGPSGTAGLTYAAGSESARDVLEMINQGASTTMATGHGGGYGFGAPYYDPLTDYNGYGAAATVYTVKPGDTLTKIALAYTGDMSRYTEILAVNTIPDPNRIEVGQQIVLPAAWVLGGAPGAGGSKVNNAGGPGSSVRGGSTIRPDFWTSAARGVETFMPLIQTGIQEITAGRRNSASIIAGQIAKKQQQLARTGDPVKRAQLQAEIASLQQQQAAYSQLLSQGAPPPADDLTNSSASVSSWVPWAVLGIGGVLALAAITASSGKRPQRT